MTSRVFAGVAVSVAVLVGAVPVLTQSPPATAKYGRFGIDLTSRNTSVKPGDDFWAYANGAWDARTQIAADRASAGNAINLVEEAEANVRGILDEMARNPVQYGASGKQIGDFYASWMNVEGIEARGSAVSAPYLARIAAANDRSSLQEIFAAPDFASPVNLGIIPSLSNPAEYTAVVAQGGLGMPRDYYLLPGEKYDGFRKAYRVYVEQIQTIAGIRDASTKADAIVALETAMAREHWPPEENRNIAKLNDPQTIEGLKAKAPEFDWRLMVGTAGLSSSPTVLMMNNTALVAMGKIFAATPVETWQAYLAYHFISDHAQYLPKAFDDARFDFFSKTLAGVPTQRERWKRGVQLVNGTLGEAVGAVYVAKFYPPAAEKQMAELIENLRAAYQQRIMGSAWMDDATKKAALVKLAAFEPRIGHPATYLDYSSIKVDRNDLLGNAMRAGEFRHQLDVQRLPKPVDRSLWVMTPQTVNAYYSPLTNQITFPAAILQPPYFDANADPAVNYGAIGAIIGHEMGHGFDDQGSQFGPTGKFENWWTDAAKKAFKDRTAALTAQYDAYEPLAGTRIKGSLTLGENIGDLGGIEAAYAAYQRYQAQHGKAAAIDGLSGDQRFFLAYAQSWRSKAREGALRQQLLTDPHSPAKYRTNGVVRNVDAWYQAFDVKPGDVLYLPPDQRVHIW